jgi:predicted transcriptional regulator
MKRTTMFIDPQLERELQALARRDGRPMAALVREAIAQYVAAARAQRTGRLGFIAAGRSGRSDIADRHEDLLFDANPPSPAKSRPRSRRPASPRRRRPA